MNDAGEVIHLHKALVVQQIFTIRINTSSILYDNR